MCCLSCVLELSLVTFFLSRERKWQYLIQTASLYRQSPAALDKAIAKPNQGEWAKCEAFTGTNKNNYARGNNCLSFALELFGSFSFKWIVATNYKPDKITGSVLHRFSPAHALGAFCGSVPRKRNWKKSEGYFFQRSAGSAVAWAGPRGHERKY